MNKFKVGDVIIYKGNSIILFNEKAIVKSVYGEGKWSSISVDWINSSLNSSTLYNDWYDYTFKKSYIDDNRICKNK